LGSTSFRLVVADWDPGIGLVPRVQRRKHLNLGMVVGREGRIPEPHASAAVKAVTKLRRRAELSGTDRIVAVATSALRDAGNGEKVARRLAAAAGVPVHILSGDEEAALTFRALQAGLPLPPGFRGRLEGHPGGPVLGVDLGGGSLELAVGTGSRLDWTSSLELGASRLVGRFVRHDPVTRNERARIEAHIETVLDTLPGDSPWPAACVAAGGTVKSLARLMIASGAAAGPLHGLQLATVDIEALGELLLVEGRRRRCRIPGMDRHRVDVLGAGTLVLARLLRRLDLAEVTVSEWGLREGVILEAAEQAQGVPAEAPLKAPDKGEPAPLKVPGKGTLAPLKAPDKGEPVARLPVLREPAVAF
jgi:exopolyphosphatase/guanosine-5'-triphosphate,3'-diphosphate pyrophosphatase